MNDLKNLLENSYNNLEETLGISNLSQGISFIKNRENFKDWDADLNNVSDNELKKITDLQSDFDAKVTVYNTPTQLFIKE